MLLRSLIKNLFSKIKKEQVLNSSYSELAALIARKYSNKEFKNANAVCLHEIQQQHKIISPGDWILDVGAGPDFYWTQLALQLAEDEKRTHRVISNDRIQSMHLRSNQVYVKGSFLEEPVRTNIGLKIGDRKLNTILVDASPQFTGKLQEDGAELNKIVFETMYFSNIFLEKGGNFVCKVLNCQSTKILEETARIFFHQFFIFRPSVIRESSPVQFFIMKGFAMNYELQAMKEFILRYRGSPKNKTDVVREYQGKYSWDPIQVIRNKVKNDALNLKLERRSDRDIENMFTNDPFIKIGEILKQIRSIEQAKQAKDGIALKRAVNKFTDGKLYKDAQQIPSSRVQWINFLQKMQNDIKQLRKKDKPQKAVQNLEPLRDNQVYMKDNYQTADVVPDFLYIEADLQGKYELEFETEYIQQELAKMHSDNPDIQTRIQKLKKGVSNKATLDEVFNPNALQNDQKQVEQNFKEMTQALQAISDEDFKEMMDKEGYENELQENVAHRENRTREKFKNR